MTSVKPIGLRIVAIIPRGIYLTPLAIELYGIPSMTIGGILKLGICYAGRS